LGPTSFLLEAQLKIIIPPNMTVITW